MDDALRALSEREKEALRLLVQIRGRREIRKFRGKLKWSGNLGEMRLDK